MAYGFEIVYKISKYYIWHETGSAAFLLGRNISPICKILKTSFKGHQMMRVHIFPCGFLDFLNERP